MFFVTLISIDRFISIRCHYSSRKLGKTSSSVLVGVLWITSFVLGVIPSGLSGISFEFYDNSHVCIGLPLSILEIYRTKVSEQGTRHCVEDAGEELCYWTQPVKSEYLGKIYGMYFATVMFLGLNFICFIVIMVCYVEIARTALKTSRRAVFNSQLKEQMRMTAKVAAIVLTDFACWFPIIILGILVQAGTLTLPPSVFAWCVIFILPINSAINPYLYTIAALISKRRNRRREMFQSHHTQGTEMGVVSTRQQSDNDTEQYHESECLTNMPNAFGESSKTVDTIV